MFRILVPYVDLTGFKIGIGSLKFRKIIVYIPPQVYVVTYDLFVSSLPNIQSVLDRKLLITVDFNAPKFVNNSVSYRKCVGTDS